jgi:serine/threonine protein kinase
MNSHTKEDSTQISALGLQVKEMLGQGSFAQVYRCYDYLKNKEYAVKVNIYR